MHPYLTKWSTDKSAIIEAGCLLRHPGRGHRMNNVQFTRIDSAFAMVCRVEVDIAASAEIVWSLLVDAAGFPRWNSTVTRIEGQIVDGARLRIHVPGTPRTFTPKVSVLVPHRHMAWSDGLAAIFKGVRTFRVQARGDTSTNFLMEERFSGVAFALTRKMLPDFRPIFESYANDLQREAQRVQLAHRDDAGSMQKTFSP
jgi:hypothetical protein